MGIKELLSGFITQTELLNYFNTTIDYEELPNRIDGFVFNYKDYSIIIINKNLSYYKKKKTILHELAHIELNQLNQSDRDLFALKVSSYEDEADKYVKFIVESIKENNIREKTN